MNQRNQCDQSAGTRVAWQFVVKGLARAFDDLWGDLDSSTPCRTTLGKHWARWFMGEPGFKHPMQNHSGEAFLARRLFGANCRQHKCVRHAAIKRRSRLEPIWCAVCVVCIVRVVCVVRCVCCVCAFEAGRREWEWELAVRKKNKNPTLRMWGTKKRKSSFARC